MFCFCFISYPSTIPSSHTSSLLYPSHAYNLKQRGKPTPPIEDSTLVEHKMQSTKLNI
ncbi:hypothetical protein GYH30_030393 [Glycine max]|nr:hypothetical protein GYH30_030393 [Glycine max]